ESLAVPLGDDLGRLRTGRAVRPAPGAAVIFRFRATPDPAGLDARARSGGRGAVAWRKRDYPAVDFVGLSRFVERVAGSGHDPPARLAGCSGWQGPARARRRSAGDRLRLLPVRWPQRDPRHARSGSAVRGGQALALRDHPEPPVLAAPRIRVVRRADRLRRYLLLTGLRRTIPQRPPEGLPPLRFPPLWL